MRIYMRKKLRDSAVYDNAAWNGKHSALDRNNLRSQFISVQL